MTYEGPPMAEFHTIPCYTDEPWRVTRHGSVYVYPGAIQLVVRQSRLTREPAKVFTHTAGKVRVNHCPIPPWQNTILFFDVSSIGLPVCAYFLAWQRKRLERAIIEAGFELEIKRKLFFSSTRY